MQQGFEDRNGEQIEGMREMLEKLRRRRQEPLEQHDLGGVYDDIAEELREVVDTERAGIDRPARRGPRVGRPPPPGADREVADERRLELDLLPPDLAGQVREPPDYDFTTTEARQRFEELIDKLREQLMQQHFNQMSGAMQDVSPEDMARMKDMLAELNQMLEQRAAGRGARLRRASWSATATSSRRTPRPSTSCSR